MTPCFPAPKTATQIKAKQTPKRRNARIPEASRGVTGGEPDLMRKARKKRVSQGVSVLRQIRKAQCFCIPRVPFVRVVREISDMCKKGLRWYYTPIFCLKGALEDYLIEYFNLLVDLCLVCDIKVKHFS